MPQHPVITIPDVQAGGPDTGLVLSRGTYYAAYTEDGRRRRQSLVTSKVTMARSLRDHLYRTLLREGATVAAKGRKTVTAADRKAAAKEDPHLYIHERKPYTVNIGGRIVAEAKTYEEAFQKRNNYLGIR